MVMGKGGVGKTTVAAAIAVELARRGHDVHLTTSDPAAHLAETLDGSLDRLAVSRIDPHVETERYRREVLAQQGRASRMPQGRALLEEDLRSPCTEEVAVFRRSPGSSARPASASSSWIPRRPGTRCCCWMRPGAYHREFARQVGPTGMHFTTPMMQLQDPKRTKVILVTLAETTPVLEAAGLQDDLRRAGIDPWAWIVNNSLAAARPTSHLLQRRAMAEVEQIEAVADSILEPVCRDPIARGGTGRH